jgi:stress response protein SCP2
MSPMELLKGSNIGLAASAVEVTIAWDPPTGSNHPVGLDVCALRLGADARVREDADFVFFNMPITPDGAVRHCGPMTEAETAGGQSETIWIDLAGQPADVCSIVVTATIDVATPELTFSGVQIRACARDVATGTQVATFAPAALTTERALITLEVYRRGPAGNSAPSARGMTTD